MRHAGVALFAASAATLARAALAQAAPRDFCPDRPERANPPCVGEPGRVETEASLGDWSLTPTSASRWDQLLIGDVFIRTGLTWSVEARIGFTSYGFTRTRDARDAPDVQAIVDIAHRF